MSRNNKIILIVTIAAVIIVGALVLAFKSNRQINNKLLGQNTEQTGQNQSVKPQVSTNQSPSTQNTSNDQSQTTQPEDSTQKENSLKAAKDIKVKAVYLTGISAGNSAKISSIIELSKKTELNAVVIDVKEAGLVNYKSGIPEVVSNKAYTNYYDPEKVTKTLHENNIYVIGRVVCFRDPILAVRRADLAVKRPNGQLWKENGVTPWANPYNEDVWKYNIEIAKEAIDKGFDEIQFDYVRFPTARKSDINYGSNVPPKADAICGFLQAAEKELHGGKGVPVSADIFGIICESPVDGESIGQVLERVGTDIDFISPMVYPSHYANASHGVMGNGVGQTLNGVNFTAPDMKPYEVVFNTLIKAKERISKVQAYNAKMRPYLQAFTASYIRDKRYYQAYGAEQIKQQMKAVYDAGYEQWILWDPSNNYKEGYFEAKK